MQYQPPCLVSRCRPHRLLLGVFKAQTCSQACIFDTDEEVVGAVEFAEVQDKTCFLEELTMLEKR